VQRSTQAHDNEQQLEVRSGISRGTSASNRAHGKQVEVEDEADAVALAEHNKLAIVENNQRSLLVRFVTEGCINRCRQSQSYTRFDTQGLCSSPNSQLLACRKTEASREGQPSVLSMAWGRQCPGHRQEASSLASQKAT